MSHDLSHRFLCIRAKEKAPVSAIIRSLDHTQETTPTQLLELCSGRFESQVTGHVTRQPSDSSSSQGMRDLLGLSPTPTPGPGSNGLVNTGPVRTDFSQINEVIGLCSGVFPTTQPIPPGYHGDSESDDDDMPRITKKKRVQRKTTTPLTTQ